MNSPRKLIEELRFYRSKADTMYSEVEDGLYTVEEFHKALERLENRTLHLLDTYTEQRLNEIIEDAEPVDKMYCCDQECHGGMTEEYANGYNDGKKAMSDNLKQAIGESE